PDASPEATLQILLEEAKAQKVRNDTSMGSALAELSSKSKQACGAMGKVLADERSEFRWVLLGEMARLGFGRSFAHAVPLLVQRLRDKDEVMQEMAVRILGDMGPNAKEAIPELTRLAGGKEPLARVAAEALENIDVAAAARMQSRTRGSASKSRRHRLT